MPPEMKNKECLLFYEDNYDLIKSCNYGAGKLVFIGDKQNRICRFCKNDKTKTTFKNKSHAIPEFMGNKQLILVEECDNCNKFFSVNLEDHLDKFTRPYRTLAQIKGKQKIPVYRSRDGKNRIEHTNQLNIYNQGFLIRETKNSATLTIDFEPHIPAAVYKALVKIAISLIEDPKELCAFETTIRWLLDPDHSKLLISPLILESTFTLNSRPNKNVFACLLRKKKNKHVAHCIFVLGVGNFIYKIIVPSCADELLEFPIKFPMPFFPIFLKDEFYSRSIIDLSSPKKESFKRKIRLSFM